MKFSEICLTIAVVILVTTTIHDHISGYNLTKEDITEGKILELCVKWNIENPVCSMIYGDIGNSNGEPIK